MFVEITKGIFSFSLFMLVNYIDHFQMLSVPGINQIYVYYWIQFVNILFRILDLGLQMWLTCNLSFLHCLHQVLVAKRDLRGRISNKVLDDHTVVFSRTLWRMKRNLVLQLSKDGFSLMTPSSRLQKETSMRGYPDILLSWPHVRLLQWADEGSMIWIPRYCRWSVTDGLPQQNLPST